MGSNAAAYQQDSLDPSDDALRGEGPRIRLVSYRAQRAPSGICRAEVALQRLDGRHVLGAREGRAAAVGDLRIVAEATLDALHLATTTDHRFELYGVKTVRAFDQTVVLVQIGILVGVGPARLVGAALGDLDLTRAAVLSVLNATNRVLWLPAA